MKTNTKLISKRLLHMGRIFSKHFSTNTKDFLNIQTLKAVDHSNLFDYIKSFKAVSYKTERDFILIDEKNIKGGRLENKNVLVYEFQPKSTLIPYLLFRQLLILFVFLSLVYYLTYKKKKYILFPVFLFVFVSVMKNNRYQYWRYVKGIELTKDLMNLEIVLLNKKRISTPLKDVFIFNRKAGRLFDFLAKDSGETRNILTFNVKDKIYYLNLKQSVIPDRDLLSLTVRGYNLKLK